MATRMLQHTKAGHLGVTVRHNGWFAHVDGKPTPLNEIEETYHEEIKRNVREVAKACNYNDEMYQ